jgi:NADH:ubiquinone oxidoreductase subunit B-like Fe-S oxidoreductase
MSVASTRGERGTSVVSSVPEDVYVCDTPPTQEAFHVAEALLILRGQPPISTRQPSRKTDNESVSSTGAVRDASVTSRDVPQEVHVSGGTSALSTVTLNK